MAFLLLTVYEWRGYLAILFM